MHHRSHVRDWMTSQPVTVLEEQSLLGAYRLMQARDIRRLPVVDPQGMLVGIVTRSDIHQVLPFTETHGERVEAMFALAGMTVDEIMTRAPLSVTPDDTIKDAALQMIKHHISGLPVVDKNRVVGIITESDIFKIVATSWVDDDHDAS